MSKVLISMSDGLLDRVDKAAASGGLSRSAYLAQLVEREIARTPGPGRARAAHQTMRQLDELFQSQPTGSESTTAVRSARDSR